MHIRLGLWVATGTCAVWAFTLLLRWFGPIEYTHTGIEALPVVFGFLAGALLAVAYWIVLPRRPRSERMSAVARQARSKVQVVQVAFMVACSMAYLTAILIDKSAAFVVGATVLRYEAIAAGGETTVSGALHQYLAGAPVLLALMLLSPRTSLDSRLVRPLLWVLVATCFMSYFLSGGRNSFFIGATVILLGITMQRRLAPAYVHSNPKPGPARTWHHRFALFVGLASGVVYSMYLFVERAAIRNTDLSGAVRILNAEYSASVLGMDLPPMFEAVYNAGVLLVFYFTHQIGYVAEYFRDNVEPMAMGGYSFFLYARTVDVVVGTDWAQSALTSLIVPGVYLTLPGSFYVDFGMAGVFLAGFIPAGLLLYFSRRVATGGRFSDLIFAAYFGTMLLLSPVYTITGIALGPSLLFMAVLQRGSELLLAKSRPLPRTTASGPPITYGSRGPV